MQHDTQGARFDDRELRSLRDFFEIGDDDLARLAAARPIAERHIDEIVEDFYKLLLSHLETRRLFSDEGVVRRVKRLQRAYFLGLFEGRCDVAYVTDRLRVGAAHERIGMAPKWYIGAYRKYLSLIHARLRSDFAVEDEARAVFESVQKLVALDMAIAVEAYIEANLETLGRHQAAIRELSTPVIKVHEQVLMLPLVGAIDSQRAQQVMETVLVRVTDVKARVIIIDIAGVPVVDTRVADHLLKTTAAVRLLGAKTILTGISAQVARTIVQLGVDISAMQTRSSLSEGIELALAMVGRTITEAKG